MEYELAKLHSYFKRKLGVNNVVTRQLLLRSSNYNTLAVDKTGASLEAHLAAVEDGHRSGTTGQVGQFTDTAAFFGLHQWQGF